MKGGDSKESRRVSQTRDPSQRGVSFWFPFQWVSEIHFEKLPHVECVRNHLAVASLGFAPKDAGFGVRWRATGGRGQEKLRALERLRRLKQHAPSGSVGRVFFEGAPFWFQRETTLLRESPKTEKFQLSFKGSINEHRWGSVREVRPESDGPKGLSFQQQARKKEQRNRNKVAPNLSKRCFSCSTHSRVPNPCPTASLLLWSFPGQNCE